MTAPRLHVVTALSSPMAVVFRRGPSGKVASLGWNRTTGEITMGQWLAGRIYEYRCDLSPDGRHLVYFATKQSRQTGHRAWTAVSRAPYLRAIHLVPQDSTWGGGGAFTRDGALWPYLGLDGVIADGLNQAEAAAFPHSTDGIFQGGTHGAKLALRGWRHLDGAGYDARFGRDLGGGVLLEHGYAVNDANRAIVSSRYHLTQPGHSRTKTNWEWADLWQGTLQYAEHGALWQAPVLPDGTLQSASRVHDFCDMTFEALSAPYGRTPFA